MDHHKTLANGGLGMIVIKDASIDVPFASTGERRISIDDDKFIPSLVELARVIHKYGYPTF